MKKLFLVIVLVMLASCTISQSNTKEIIQKGFSYLNQTYENGKYNDKYLLYVYPGEQLVCPLKDCNITYRVLDSYFNLAFIKKEVKDYSSIKDQVDHADEVLRSLLPTWEKGKIYNTAASTQEDKDGFALDTYCILGYIYEDKEMALTTLKYLKNNDWMPEDYFKEDEWRNIADESWCIRLLLKTNTEPELTRVLLQNKVNETYDFIKKDYDNNTKVAAVIHTILMLNDATGFDKDLNFFQDYLANLSGDAELKKDLHLQANVLEALAKSKYKDSIKLKEIADFLVKNQDAIGAWYMDKQNKDFLQVFTTFRAILALNAYETKNEN